MKARKNILFKIEGDYIELIQLLKAVNLAESGGQAKQFVEQGMVKVNDKRESRKRAKLRPGDKVLFNGMLIALE